MEDRHDFASMERARNAAVQWLEVRGVTFGPYREVEIGRLGVLTGKEVGVSGTRSPYWRLRLDYDPSKGPHYNAEIGKGSQRAKAAFTFPGDESLIATLAQHRNPR